MHNVGSLSLTGMSDLPDRLQIGGKLAQEHGVIVHQLSARCGARHPPDQLLGASRNRRRQACLESSPDPAPLTR